MKKYFLAIVLFTFCWQVNAQHTYDSRSEGMGTANAALWGINALTGNPAGLGYLEQTGFLLTAQNRFLVSELNSILAGAAIPTNPKAFGSGTFSLSVQQFGFDAFNRQTIGIGYSRKLFDQFSIGGKVDVINTQIQEYGQRAVVTFEFGFQAVLLEKLHWGGHIFSPIDVEITEDEVLPTILRLGFAYEVSKQFLLVAEAEKDIDYDLRIKAGFEYLPVESFAFRAGISSNPSDFHFGVGYKWSDQLMVDLAGRFHQTLGFTPSVNVVYLLKKKK